MVFNLIGTFNYYNLDNLVSLIRVHEWLSDFSPTLLTPSIYLILKIEKVEHAKTTNNTAATK